MTETAVDRESQQKIPNVLYTTGKKHLPFRNEQYIKRSKKFNAKISKIRPSSFRYLENNNNKLS